MKRSFTSLRLSLCASRIIYLSFQDSKSVVFDRRANQAFQMDDKQEVSSLFVRDDTTLQEESSKQCL